MFLAASFSPGTGPGVLIISPRLVRYGGTQGTLHETQIILLICRVPGQWNRSKRRVANLQVVRAMGTEGGHIDERVLPSGLCYFGLVDVDTDGSELFLSGQYVW